MNRWKIVEMSVELFQEWVTEGWMIGPDYAIECTQGLPEGAVFVEARYGNSIPSLLLIFEHPSFEEVRPGGEIPRIHVVHEKRRWGP